MKKLSTLIGALPAALQPIHIHGKAADHTTIAALIADSRKAAPHTLFIAIRGAVSDGHDYLLAAYENGCRCFLVEQPAIDMLPPDATVYAVSDTKAAKAHLAAAYYDFPAAKMSMVGITGTKGKTTSALLCYDILRRIRVNVGYIGTEGVRYFANNSEHTAPTVNTTPDPLELHFFLREMYDMGVRTVFVEVSSQSVYQQRIAGITFAVGAFTNLSPDHVSPTEHPTLEHYKECKHAFLRDHVSLHGSLVLNADDPHTPDMAADCATPIRTFGIHQDADTRAEQLTPYLLSGVPATRFYVGGQAATLSLPGEYNVSNALCALEILRALGYPTRALLPYLTMVKIPGRLESLSAPDGAAIFIDYAHNGVSLAAVLSTLRQYAKGRLICLVGSVGGRTQLRRRDLGDAAAKYADLTILTADNPDFEDTTAICEDMALSFRACGLDNYRIIPDRTDAIRHAVSVLREGDILLLAGKGNEDYQRIRGESQPFSERQVVIESVRELSRLS